MYSGGHLRWATSIEIVPKKKLTLDGHHCTHVYICMYIRMNIQSQAVNRLVYTPSYKLYNKIVNPSSKEKILKEHNIN